MKKKFQAAYVPIGVGTFHMPTAHGLFDESIGTAERHLRGYRCSGREDTECGSTQCVSWIRSILI